MSESGFEIQKPPEQEISPHSIAIATSTLYKDWYPGQQKDQGDTDKLRGDLAIKTLQEAQKKGFQIAVVDGGSSEAFLQALSSAGIILSIQEEKGMSPGRRQVLTEASNLPGAKVLVWTEPEKVSLVKDCLPTATAPIIRGEADIVIPKRDDKGFASYPSEQAKSEQRSNRLWNNILRSRGLLQGEDLDAFFGPRFIRNDPEVLELFLQQYEYRQIPPITPGDEKQAKELKQIFNLESYPDSLYFPIITALQKGYRVISVPVLYRHPAEQTEAEQGDPEFERKRKLQYENINFATSNFVKKIQDKRNRLERYR